MLSEIILETYLAGLIDASGVVSILLVTTLSVTSRFRNMAQKVAASTFTVFTSFVSSRKDALTRLLRSPKHITEKSAPLNVGAMDSQRLSQSDIQAMLLLNSAGDGRQPKKGNPSKQTHPSPWADTSPNISPNQKDNVNNGKR